MSFNSILVFAQGKENSLSPFDLSIETIAFKKQEKLLSEKLPFSSIKVIDARFDSSKLGFIRSRKNTMNYKKEYQQLKLIDGVEMSLERYYNTHLSKNSTAQEYKLLIVMKKFWMTSTKKFNFQKNIASRDIDESARIVAKWELYIFKDDTFLPFRRIDTIIESKLSLNLLLLHGVAASYYNKENIYGVLNGFIEQFDYSQAIKVFAERKKTSLTEIKHFNNERFNLPVLAYPKYQKGVYLTFDEFKNNTPSIINFSEKKMTFGITRKDNYIVNDKDSVINQFYAYATDELVKVGPYGNETIFRNGNSFEFFLKIRMFRGNSGESNPFSQHLVMWIPFQIDMETGEFY